MHQINTDYQDFVSQVYCSRVISLLVSSKCLLDTTEANGYIVEYGILLTLPLPLHVLWYYTNINNYLASSDFSLAITDSSNLIISVVPLCQ